MIGKLVLLCCVVLLHQTESLKLPSYMKPCRRGDPKFNECAKKHGQEAIPSLVKGDKKYKIPQIEPFSISEVSFNQGNNFNIMFKNLKLHGLSKATVSDVNFDFNKKHFSLSLKIPVLDIDADYEVSGKILILPISGKGPANLHFENLDLTYDFDYELVKKGSEEYMKYDKGNLEYHTKFFKSKLDNLFNGDKVLGPETQNFLNENWREVLDELRPTLKGTISEIIHVTLKGFTDVVPYNELFSEKL